MLDILEKLNAVYSDCVSKRAELESELKSFNAKFSSLAEKEANLKEREAAILPIENLQARASEVEAREKALSKALDDLDKRESGFRNWHDKERTAINNEKALIRQEKENIINDNQALKSAWEQVEDAKKNMRVDIHKELLKSMAR